MFEKSGKFFADWRRPKASVNVNPSHGQSRSHLRNTTKGSPPKNNGAGTNAAILQAQIGNKPRGTLTFTPPGSSSPSRAARRPLNSAPPTLKTSTPHLPKWLRSLDASTTSPSVSVASSAASGTSPRAQLDHMSAKHPESARATTPSREEIDRILAAAPDEIRLWLPFVLTSPSAAAPPLPSAPTTTNRPATNSTSPPKAEGPNPAGHRRNRRHPRNQRPFVAAVLCTATRLPAAANPRRTIQRPAPRAAPSTADSAGCSTHLPSGKTSARMTYAAPPPSACTSHQRRPRRASPSRPSVDLASTIVIYLDHDSGP